MARGSFDRALALVLELEGGFVDHPRDPGGATNLGITRATLAKWRRRPVSAADVKALTPSEAGKIYRTSYWDAVRGDDLPPGLDLATFDYAVNSGPTAAVRSLQTVLGLRADGRIGPVTLSAAKANDPAKTVHALTRERLRVLRSLSTWPVFGRGWTSRTTRVEREALALSAERARTGRVGFIFPSEEKEHGMFETKTVLASRTVWSNVIGLGCLVLGLLGVQTGSIDANGLADAAVQIVAGVSFVASTFFRVRATKQIGAA